MSELALTVERRDWYRREDGGNLVYPTTYPPGAHVQGSRCNCTTHAAERPTSEHRGTSLVARWDSADPHIEVRLDGCAPFPRFTFRWQGEGTRKAKDGQLDFAYFWWNRLGVKVEVTGTGDLGHIDATLLDLYFGKDGDYSSVRQGHMHPSPEVVPLSTMPADALWVYHSSWGEEGMGMLKEPEECELWWKAHLAAQTLRKFVQEHLKPGLSNEALHSALTPSRADAKIDWLCTFFQEVLRNFKGTDLYRAAQVARSTRKAA